MTPEQLADAIQAVLGQAAQAGDLTLETVPAVRVERPRNRDHGDWSTNVALQLAKPTGLSGREVARVLSSRLTDVDGIASVEAAGPGFVNITLEASSAGALARTIVESGSAYGRNDRSVPTRTAPQQADSNSFTYPFRSNGDNQKALYSGQAIEN